MIAIQYVPKAVSQELTGIVIIPPWEMHVHSKGEFMQTYNFRTYGRFLLSEGVSASLLYCVPARTMSYKVIP